MIIANENIVNMIDSPSRELNARVELYEGSTLLQIFKYSDALKSVAVDRVGQQGKFFGFGVVQKLTVELMDKERAINITDKNTLELEFGVDADYVYCYPFFKVTEVKRNENTNDLTITAYDALNDAATHTVKELELPTSYTIREFVIKCGKLLGLVINIEGVTDSSFELNFETGANFEGTETIRQALDAVAEATQTVYFVNSQWELTFKRLDKDGSAVKTIDKSKYFTLDSGTNKTLVTICSATELGDNVSDTITETVTTKNRISKAVKVTHSNDVYADYVATDTGDSISHTIRGNVGTGLLKYDTGLLMFPYANKGTIATCGIPVSVGNFVLSFKYELLEQGAYNNQIALLIYAGDASKRIVDATVSPSADRIQIPFTVTEEVIALGDKVCVTFRANNNYIRIADMQIEKGTTATNYEYPFEPYERDITGDTQYIRNNPFWELRDDVGALVSAAVDNVGGMSINPFTCDARGNFLLEIGDRLDFVTKDNKTITSYLLNDTITYNGGLSQNMSWSGEDNSAETDSNPVTLGEKLKQTYAKVDKANKQIELLVSETDANSEQISKLQMDTQAITASVGVINKDIDELSKKVEVAVTPEDVTIAIKQEAEKGTNKVTTNTGFTFNDEGLTITKNTSEMSTQITEDGMTVSKDGNEVLTANNKGVKAIDLHAKTYLIIGKNSRFEDYEENRTGCFWIGG